MITLGLWLICEPEGREKWRFDFRLFQLFYLLIIFLSNKEGLSTFLFSQRLGWKRIYFLSFNLSSCVMRKYPDAKLGSAQADILWRGNVFWYLPGFAVPGISNICVQSGDGERSSAGGMGWCRRKHSSRESEFGSAFGCVPLRGNLIYSQMITSEKAVTKRHCAQCLLALLLCQGLVPTLEEFLSTSFQSSS